MHAHLNIWEKPSGGDPIYKTHTNAHLNIWGVVTPFYLLRHTNTCGFSFTFIILNNYWGRDEWQYFCRKHRESELT